MYIEESIWGYVIMMGMIFCLDVYTRRMRKTPELVLRRKRRKFENK